MPDPIRVFIGSEPRAEIARLVLEDSILRATSRPVEFTPMLGKGWEDDVTGIPVGTKFSLRRFLIPRQCGYKGRAIYLDADTLCFADIGGLWDALSPDAVVAATWQKNVMTGVSSFQSSAMVFDCEQAHAYRGWHPGAVFAALREAGRDDYMKFMTLAHPKLLHGRADRVDEAWNHLEKYHPAGTHATKILHFTVEPRQPWRNPAHPLAPIWEAAFKKAIASGRVTAAALDAAEKTPGALCPRYLKLGRRLTANR